MLELMYILVLLVIFIMIFWKFEKIFWLHDFHQQDDMNCKSENILPIIAPKIEKFLRSNKKSYRMPRGASIVAVSSLANVLQCLDVDMTTVVNSTI